MADLTHWPLLALYSIIQALAWMIEMEDKPDDDYGLLRFSVASVLVSKVDLNLRLYLSALQMRACSSSKGAISVH